MKEPTSILLEMQYFPPVQYFSKLILHKSVLIEQHENYLKATYRNRCHIASVNGIQRLTVPLKKGKNEQQSIRAVQISYSQPWQAQHWQAIQSAYGNAPYFEFYADEIAPFFKKKYEFLFDWNLDLFKCLIACLSINCDLMLTDTFLPFTQNQEDNIEVFDFRNGIHPKKHRQKEDSKFRPAKYAQVFEDKHGFLPNLSMLDLLFCAGPESYAVLENSIPNANK